MKKFHLIFGIIILIVFALTGQYMHHEYNHLIDMPLTERALFRAGHIYILFIALINVALGSYFKLEENTYRKSLQLIGSLLIIISTFLFIYSFFKELPTNEIERAVSRNAIYTTLAGILFHGFSTLKFKK